MIKKLESQDYSVSEFFSKAELAKLSEYEMKRYKNMRKNYELMLAVGKFYNYVWVSVKVLQLYTLANFESYEFLSCQTLLVTCI